MLRSGLTDRDLFRLVAWALRGDRQDPDWDDLFQEGLIGAWKQARETVDPATARTRVVRAARWAALEYRRLAANRDARETVPLEEWDGKTGDLSERFLSALERRELCRQALAAMSARERRYVQLWIGQGVGQQQIAEAEQVTVSRIATIIRRGLKRARRSLEEAAGERTSG